jgi:hypothetical protein
MPGRLIAVKPSQRYAEHAKLLMGFRQVYVDLINSSRPKEGDYFLPELGPAPGVDWQTWSQKRSAVARAAGAASAVYHRYGGTFTLRNAA